MLIKAVVEISSEIALNRGDMIFRLENFLHTHRGWAIEDIFETGNKKICFYDLNIFKQFIVEFVESPYRKALSKEEASKELKKLFLLK